VKEAERKRAVEQEEIRKRGEQAKQQQKASINQTSNEEQRRREVEQKLEKKLHYIDVFVGMQKEERQRTKARRQEAREARQLRIATQKNGSSPPVPVVVSTSELSTPAEYPPPQSEQETIEEELEVDREIEMIIEIGKLKEEVDTYKRMCKEEEARVAALKKQAQAKAEAEARRKRGWVASGTGGGSAIISKASKPASIYQTKDITKRPLVGGARYLPFL
jgi:hypothetical protein